MRTPNQSPSYHGRYPRTMEEAYGDGARLTPEDEAPIDWVNVACYIVLVLCAVAMGVLLAWRG